MSRSYKRVPIFGIGMLGFNVSEKLSKRWANRKLRRRVRRAIAAGKEILPVMKEVSNPWCWPCDGWGYYRDADAKAMRK